LRDRVTLLAERLQARQAGIVAQRSGRMLQRQFADLLIDPRLVDRHRLPIRPEGCDDGRQRDVGDGDAGDLGHGGVIASSDHRLDEPELADAPLEGVKLIVADPPRVGGIRAELVDRGLLASRGVSRHLRAPTVRVNSCRQRDGLTDHDRPADVARTGRAAAA
jgi:hypothetical protein